EIGFFVVYKEPFVSRGHVPDNGPACRADTDRGSVGAKRHDVRSWLARKNRVFFSRGRVPEANGVVPPTRRDATTIRAEGHRLHVVLVPPQDGPSAVRLAGKVPPFPAAMLRGRVVQGPLGGTDIVRLHGAGGGDQVSPIALPAFGFLLALGLDA